jgi:hypothetical protein
MTKPASSRGTNHQSIAGFYFHLGATVQQHPLARGSDQKIFPDLTTAPTR